MRLWPGGVSAVCVGAIGLAAGIARTYVQSFADRDCGVHVGPDGRRVLHDAHDGVATDDGDPRRLGDEVHGPGPERGHDRCSPR